MVPERVHRIFPRGPADLLVQVAIWFGFGFAYQVARGLADQNVPKAFTDAIHVVHIERAMHMFVEPNIQHVIVQTGGLILTAVNWTYWLSQFVVLALALLWIYFRHNEAFPRARNWIIATNLLSLLGYVFAPTAPPRMFPEFGFTDTLAQSASLNHGSGIVQLASNQFAAVPSVHAADALIIGFLMASLVRSRIAKLLWTLWPSWVWFSVMATGNHYWFDIAAGVGVAMAAGTLLTWLELRRSGAPALQPPRRW